MCKSEHLKLYSRFEIKTLIISIGQLNTLLYLHLQPINLLVSKVS